MRGAIGHVTAVQYQDMQPSVAADTSVFVIHFIAPDGEEYSRSLPNGDYDYSNPTLQFLAVNGLKPSDLDGTMVNTEDWAWYIPVVTEGDEWYLGSKALESGVTALKDAEWFSPEDENKSTDDDHSGPHGGGSPDPSTGNRGGVENEDGGGVTATLTPSKDTGVNLHVE